MKIKSFLTAALLICSLVFLLVECKKKEDTPVTATCTDGIKNEDETDVDCGGSCKACPVADPCKNGVSDNSEEGIDCGGSCSACNTSFSFVLDGNLIDIGGMSYTALISSGKLTIKYGTGSFIYEMVLEHTGALAKAIYTLGTNTSYKNSSGAVSKIVSGTIEITFINTTAKVINGKFAFVCHDAVNNIDHSIIGGSFKNIYYQ